MSPEQRHYNEVRNSIGLMKNEDGRNNYGNHATAIAVLEKHLESLSRGNIIVPKQTWEALLEALGEYLNKDSVELQLNGIKSKAIDALTVAEAVLPASDWMRDDAEDEQALMDRDMGDN